MKPLETRGVLSPAAVTDPYSYFEALRSEDPVHWSEPDGAWVLTRYADVQLGLNDQRFSSERVGPGERNFTPAQRAGLAHTLAILEGWMAFRDEPDHARLRAPVRRTFTPRRVASMQEWVEGIVDDLLADIDTEEPFNLVDALSFPLPAVVIAELLGVPPEDRNEFKWWSHKLATLVLGTGDRPDQYERARDAGTGFTEYFVELIRRYELEPADNLISALIEARGEGLALDDTEMVGACTLLLFGGHETTANLITNSALAFLRHPELAARVRSDAGLTKTAVEELLRFDGPAKIMERRVAVPVELEGRQLEPGDHVYLAISAANRDPAVFEAPDEIRLDRDPNPHLGFGYGSHFCLGASLGRLETRIAVEKLFRRFPRLSLPEQELDYSPVVLGRSLRALTLSPESRASLGEPLPV